MFKKIVIGPDTGNVGNILRSWSLPVFDIESLSTVVDAIQRGMLLSKEKYAEKTYGQLANQYSTKCIVKELQNLYSNVLASIL